MESVLVYLPSSIASQSTISITIQNGNGVSFRIDGLEVISNSYVEIDLLSLPEQFFNSYGGVYTLVYLDSDNKPVTFTADNGNQYTAVRFRIQSTNMTTGVINPFNIDEETGEMIQINYVAIALNEQQNQQDELTFLLALQNL